jgi:hypothetical protein
MAAGVQPIAEGRYQLTYPPEINKRALQEEGQAPVFYWLPNQVRMARKEGPDSGNFLFNLICFARAQSKDGTIGADEDREVAGGILTLHRNGCTARPRPAAVAAEDHRAVPAAPGFLLGHPILKAACPPARGHHVERDDNLQRFAHASWPARKPREALEQATTPGSGGGCGGSAGGGTSPRPTLRQGDRGADVKHLQEQLVAHGYSLTVDGVFGAYTHRSSEPSRRATTWSRTRLWVLTPGPRWSRSQPESRCRWR